MNAKKMKKAMAILSIFTLFAFVGCAQKMTSDTMENTMSPMSEKPMMDDMQGEKKMDSTGMMNEMENDKSVEKNTDKGMGTMDKMMK